MDVPLSVMQAAEVPSGGSMMDTMDTMAPSQGDSMHDMHDISAMGPSGPGMMVGLASSAAFVPLCTFYKYRPTSA